MSIGRKLALFILTDGVKEHVALPQGSHRLSIWGSSWGCSAAPDCEGEDPPVEVDCEIVATDDEIDEATEDVAPEDSVEARAVNFHRSNTVSFGDEFWIAT